MSETPQFSQVFVVIADCGHHGHKSGRVLVCRLLFSIRSNHGR